MECNFLNISKEDLNLQKEIQYKYKRNLQKTPKDQKGTDTPERPPLWPHSSWTLLHLDRHLTKKVERNEYKSYTQ